MTKFSIAAFVAALALQNATPTPSFRIDWNPLVLAVALAIPGIMAYLTARRVEAAAAAAEVKRAAEAVVAAAAAKEIKDKVDGNYGDLKNEVAAAKAEVVLANQRIAVLTERLITSTPAQTPVVITNGVKGKD